MRYSIIGFNQEKILSIRKIVTKNDKEVEIKLDVTDLLILQDIADFMNRSKVIKHTIDDKIYFSMQYQTILEDLPILTIQKQALADRIDKMSILGLLEKKVIKNQCGTFTAFRLSEQYENLLYSRTSSQTTPTSSQLQVQECSTTNHNTNITNNSFIVNKEEIKENTKRKKESTEPTDDDHAMFEEFRKKYKGKKRGHDTEFNFFISQNSDWKKVLPQLCYAVEKENQLREQARMTRTFFPEPKNMQTYLNGKNRGWELYLDGIEKFNSNDYNPICDGVSLMWNDVAKCYLTPFDITTLNDGYNAENRPETAIVMWRGYRYKWNRLTKQWEIQ